MTLTPGTRLGPYEVTAQIGVGGMGEVYRATDVRLKRDVALKVLPPAFAGDHDRMERMRREAQMLAALSHPNIAAIYGVEDHALVMELVEGTAVAGPLPLDAALQYARQVAEALEHAHDKGVVHRDLKPANIKVTADGVVKVLDFGLAKMADDRAEPADASNSPTLTMRATEAGLILGTAAYMAPEQARGAGVDRRADVWAFGVVLYEWLTGHRAFQGDTVSDILAAVLRSDIDFDRVPADTPPAIRTLLRRCLERDRKRRLQAIGEARIVIDDVLAGGPAAAASVVAAASAPPAYGWKVATLGLAVVLVAGVAGAVAYVGRPLSRPQIAQFEVALPDQMAAAFPGAVVSPDGRFIAFTSVSGLSVRPVDSLASVMLDGATLAGAASWSLDGRFLAYLGGSLSRLLRVDVSQRTRQPAIDLPFPVSGIAWAPDGSLVLGEANGGLHRLPATGGAPTPLTTVDQNRGERFHVPVAFLPDGRLLYLVIHTAIQSCATETCNDIASAFVQPLDAGAPSQVIEGVAYATYASAPDGTAVLLFVRGQTLWAQRIDPRSWQLSGEPTRQAAGVTQVSASTNGILLSRLAAPASRYDLTWFDRRGTVSGTVDVPAGQFSNPALSPDGRYLAVSVTDASVGTRDIWVIDLARNTSSRFTSSPGDEMNPAWSPDGETLAYSSAETNSEIRRILRKPAFGVGDAEVLIETKGANNVESWSPDGRDLLYNVGSRDIWRLRLAGTEPPVAVLEAPSVETQGQLSPDGRWLAYRSNDTGRNEVYVQAYPAASRRWQISNAGGQDPMWNPNGRELFYLNDEQLMAVPIGVRAGVLEPGLPAPLFRVPVEPQSRRNRYVVAGNGERFLFVRRIDVVAPPRWLAIVNWAPPGAR